MEFTANRYALVPFGDRYAAHDNFTGKLVTDAAGAVMTRNGRDATEWLHEMNAWEQERARLERKQLARNV